MNRNIAMTRLAMGVALLLAFGATSARADTATFYANADTLVLRPGEKVTITLGVNLDVDNVTASAAEFFVGITSPGIISRMQPLSGSVGTFSLLEAQSQQGDGVVLGGEFKVFVNFQGETTQTTAGTSVLYGYLVSPRDVSGNSLQCATVTLEVDPSYSFDDNWTFHLAFVPGVSPFGLDVPYFEVGGASWETNSVYLVNGTPVAAADGLTFTVTPEPTTWAALAGFGLVGAMWYRRRRR